MKIIKMPAAEKHKPTDVLRAVCEVAVNGTVLSEMRHRLRIMDAIDASNGTMTLEDADHEFLVRLLGEFKFAVAHPDILAACDAVLKAGTPD